MQEDCILVLTCYVLILIVLLLQVVRERYGHFAQEATLRVRFEHNEITLSIPPDGLVTTEGWRITPLAAPTVS